MVTCIFCKSSKDIVRAGFRYNKSGKKQRYKCNNCKERFVPNDGFWKMKHKPEIIAEACSCRKRGMPYNEVSKHFREYDKADICTATANRTSSFSTFKKDLLTFPPVQKSISGSLSFLQTD